MWRDLSTLLFLGDVPPAGPRKRHLRRNRKHHTRAEKTAAFIFHETVTRYGCVWCNTYPESKAKAADPWDLLLLDAHHLIPKQVLKREGHAVRVFDPASSVCLCRHHHQLHEGVRERMPAALIPERSIRFAREIGLLWLFEKTYGWKQEAA